MSWFRGRPTTVRCGQRVYLVHSERHVGVVQAVFNKRTVRVKWDDWSWITDEDIDDLQTLDFVEPKAKEGK